MPLPRKPREPKELTLEERLNQNYINLHSQLEKGSLLKALNTINKILHLTPEDSLALKTKCQILISLDQYSEVLTLLAQSNTSCTDSSINTPNTHDDVLPTTTSLKLYCQYKNGRQNEVREGLTKWEEGELDGHLITEEEERTGKILEAQVLYRLEDYEASRNAFEDLIATVEQDSPELADFQTNLEACTSHLEFLNSVPSLLESINIPSIEILESTPITSLITSHPLFKPKPLSHTTSGSIIASTSKNTTTSATLKKNKKSKSISTSTATTSSTVPKKLPKNYNPSTIPDPERWLPKRERSQYADSLAVKRETARGRRKGKEREKLLVQGGGGGNDLDTAGSGGGGGGGGGTPSKSGAGGKKKKGKK